MKKKLVNFNSLLVCSYNLAKKTLQSHKKGKFYQYKNFCTQWQANYVITGYDKAFYKNGALEYFTSLEQAETWLIIMQDYTQFENLKIEKYYEWIDSRK